MTPGTANPERWKRINQLFDDACEMPPEERRDWLHRETENDPSLLPEVMKLLAHHEADEHWIDKGVPGARSFANSTDPLAPGAVLGGKYQIIGPLGADGPCQIFAATGATVRVIHIDPNSDDAREIAAFSRAASPVTCRELSRILSVDSTALGPREALILAEEAAEATPIDVSIVSVKAQPIPVVLGLLEKSAAGLQAIHRHGLMHGTFHAGHVLASPDLETVKVCGWGTHLVPGMMESIDPDVLAPEQLLGEEITPATDVYCFGLLAYELLTTRRPFVGKNKLQSALLRLNQPPHPPLQARPDLPAHCADGLMRCLERDPAARPKDAREAMEALHGRHHGLLGRLRGA